MGVASRPEVRVQMLLQDLFKKLSYGELSGLSIGMDGAGTLTELGQAQVLTHVNAALTALHSRFILRRSELVLEAMADIETYVLDRTHAASQSQAHPMVAHYIIDSVESPFADDLIKILEVRPMVSSTVPGGPHLPVGLASPFGINNRSNLTSSARILSHKRLSLISAAPGTLFRIEYQARHHPLVLPGSPEATEANTTIEIMPGLEEALQARVAASVFLGMNGDSGSVLAREHMDRYERLCVECGLSDLAQESSTDERDRLRDKGFI